MIFHAIHENKILKKIAEFTVYSEIMAEVSF